MLEIFGKIYYIDVEELIERCRPDYFPQKSEQSIVKKTKTTKVKSEEDNEFSINIFKFETFKACVERIFSEYDNDIDEKLAGIGENSLSPSFKMAFNTLLKYKILKEAYE